MELLLVMLVEYLKSLLEIGEWLRNKHPRV